MRVIGYAFPQILSTEPQPSNSTHMLIRKLPSLLLALHCAAAALLLALAPNTLHADTLTLNSGITHEGKLISETDDEVRFEVGIAGGQGELRHGFEEGVLSAFC